jgi:hypothetical protein
MKLRCIECGAMVSTDLPKGTVVRGTTTCPECEERHAEQVASVDVQPTDLRGIGRDADCMETSVALFLENLRQGRAEWLRAGASSLYQVRNHHRPGLWILAARLGRHATDPEHDAPFAFKLPLVGVEIERIEEGAVWAFGFVDAYDGEEFHVPRPGYDPFQDRGASTCRSKACGERHPIVPGELYVPPFDAALYAAVKGRLVDIRIVPVRGKEKT